MPGIAREIRAMERRRFCRTSRSPAGVRHVDTSIRPSAGASMTTGSARASALLNPPTRMKAPGSRSAAASRCRFSSVASRTVSATTHAVLRLTTPLSRRRSAACRPAIKGSGARRSGGGRNRT